MAPDIAVQECARIHRGGTVVDPMCGSGTVLRAASLRGHRAYGTDLDPLAVLMAKVWTSPISPTELLRCGHQLLDAAECLDPRDVWLPWIDSDPETKAFVDYWFSARQQADLRRIAARLAPMSGPVADALRLSLSRIIVTKDRGASLARDVSHSRPHRVSLSSDYCVMEGFRRSFRRLADLQDSVLRGFVDVRLGDARDLGHLDTGLADLVVTSPPYLNGIDYLRGHRLSLVWLGYRLEDLRRPRVEQVGAERAASAADLGLAAMVLDSVRASAEQLSGRYQGILARYAVDLYRVMAEIARVLRPGGRAVLVVGDSSIRGVYVENSVLARNAALHLPLEFKGMTRRDLPTMRRYLPPPGQDLRNSLSKRLRTEAILRFDRVG